MLFRSMQKHNGFFLNQPFELKTSIAVLTGRNGAGKTRFLEAIPGSIQVLDGERYVMSGAIRHIQSGGMQGSLAESHFDHASSSKRLDELVLVFNSMRDKFSSPYDPMEDMEHVARGLPFSYRQIHSGISNIAKKLGKSVWDLEGNEVKLYFQAPLRMFTGLDVAALFNEYIVRKRKNLFDMWLAKECGRGMQFLELDEFEKYFGSPPWILFNDILYEIFDGKIQLDPPVDELTDDFFVPILREAATGDIVPVEGLSTGEKNLLWLVVEIFKLRYLANGVDRVPELLLLDEPDAFLHPQMVVRFYSVIKIIVDSFDCKVIFTTHSPTTVALAPDQCVYCLLYTSDAADE